jgi:hypothetical protein
MMGSSHPLRRKVSLAILVGACLLAIGTVGRWHAISGVEPVAEDSQAADDAHCGCGEEKMARVASQTRTFAQEVGTLERTFASLPSACDGQTACAEAQAAGATLARYRAACAQRQIAPDTPMSVEMRQWADACRRVAALPPQAGN